LNSLTAAVLDFASIVRVMYFPSRLDQYSKSYFITVNPFIRVVEVFGKFPG